MTYLSLSALTIGTCQHFVPTLLEQRTRNQQERVLDAWFNRNFDRATDKYFGGVSKLIKAASGVGCLVTASSVQV